MPKPKRKKQNKKRIVPSVPDKFADKGGEYFTVRHERTDRMVDTNLEFTTVHDKKGNPVQPG